MLLPDIDAIDTDHPLVIRNWILRPSFFLSGYLMHVYISIMGVSPAQPSLPLAAPLPDEPAIHPLSRPNVLW